MMTPDQFRRLLYTFGADPARWPPDQRLAAEALIDSSAEMHEQWQTAQRLDALFALDRAPPASAALKAALADAALDRIRLLPPRRGFDWRFLLSLRVEAAFAATILAGLFAGFEFGPMLDPPAPQHAVPAIAVLLGDDFEGLL